MVDVGRVCNNNQEEKYGHSHEFYQNYWFTSFRGRAPFKFYKPISNSKVPGLRSKLKL